MKGVKSVRTVFDFRVGDPKMMSGHLDLIHSMMSAPGMMKGGKPPEIVVVFIGPSVKLITKGGAEGAGEKSKAIAGKIAAMRKDGVRFEVCMTAAHAFDVAAESLLPDIVQVGNGWISVIGYQQRGFSLVSDF